MTDQALAALPLNDDEPATIEFAHGNAAAGMGGEGEPAQLDIVWANGRTLVYPAKVPEGFAYAQPWAFEGTIDPMACVAWLRAKMVPAEHDAA